MPWPISTVWPILTMWPIWYLHFREVLASNRCRKFDCTLKELLDACAKLRKGAIRFIMSVCRYIRPSVYMEQLGCQRKNCHEILYANFENVLGKFKFRYSLIRISGAVHEDQHALFIISRFVLLRMRNILDSCRENQNSFWFQ